MVVMIILKLILQHRGSVNKMSLLKGFRNIFVGFKGFRIEKKVEKYCSKLLSRTHVCNLIAICGEVVN
jgi:hypothetical protein